MYKSQPSCSNDANAIHDSEGNDVVDLASTSVTNNSTVAGTAPTISSFSPADDATEIETTSDIVLSFSEAVDYGTGNIVIYKSSDDSVVETISVTSSNVLSSGAILTTPDVFDNANNSFQVLYSETIPNIATALGLSEASKTGTEWATFVQNNYDILLNGGSHSYTCLLYTSDAADE